MQTVFWMSRKFESRNIQNTGEQRGYKYINEQSEQGTLRSDNLQSNGIHLPFPVTSKRVQDGPQPRTTVGAHWFSWPILLWKPRDCSPRARCGLASGKAPNGYGDGQYQDEQGNDG